MNLRRINAHRHQLQIVAPDSMRCNKLEPLRFPADGSTPGEAKASMLNCDAARLAEKLFSIAHAHDERIDAAQDGVNAIEAGNPAFVLLLFGYVLKSTEPSHATV